MSYLTALKDEDNHFIIYISHLRCFAFLESNDYTTPNQFPAELLFKKEVSRVSDEMFIEKPIQQKLKCRQLRHVNLTRKILLLGTSVF